MKDSRSKLRIQKKILLKLNLADQEEIENCISLQEKINEEYNISFPLPSLLFHRELITEDDLREFHEFFQENFSHLSPSMPVPLQYKFLSGYTEGKLEDIVIGSGEISNKELEQAKEIRDWLLEKNLYIKTGEILIHSEQVDPGTLRFKLLQNKISNFDTGELEQKPDEPETTPEDKDIEDRLGDIAVEHQFISEKQLDQALSLQAQFKEKGIDVALGEVLISLKFITKAELKDLLKLQQVLREDEIKEILDFFSREVPDRPEDEYLGNLALKENIITEDQLRECLDIQEQLNEFDIDRKIGEILIEKNYLTEDNLEVLLEMQTGEEQTQAASEKTVSDPKRNSGAETTSSKQDSNKQWDQWSDIAETILSNFDHYGRAEELVSEILDEVVADSDYPKYIKHEDEMLLEEMVQFELISLDDVIQIVQHAIKGAPWDMEHSPIQNSIIDLDFCEEEELEDLKYNLNKNFPIESSASTQYLPKVNRFSIILLLGLLSLGSFFLVTSEDNSSSLSSQIPTTSSQESKNPATGEALQEKSEQQAQKQNEESPQQNVQNSNENSGLLFHPNTGTQHVTFKKSLPSSMKGPFSLNFRFLYGTREIYGPEIYASWSSGRTYKVKIGTGSHRGSFPPGTFVLKGIFKKPPKTMPTDLILAGETQFDQSLRNLLTGKYWDFYLLKRFGANHEIASFRWEITQLLRKLIQELQEVLSTWQTQYKKFKERPERIKTDSELRSTIHHVKDTSSKATRSLTKLESEYFVAPFLAERKMIKKLSKQIHYIPETLLTKRIKESNFTPPKWLNTPDFNSRNFHLKDPEKSHQKLPGYLKQISKRLPQTKKDASKNRQIKALIRNETRQLLTIEHLFCKLKINQHLKETVLSKWNQKQNDTFQQYVSRIYDTSKALIALQTPLLKNSNLVMSSEEASVYRQFPKFLRKRISHYAQDIYRNNNQKVPVRFQQEQITHLTETNAEKRLQQIGLQYMCDK